MKYLFVHFNTSHVNVNRRNLRCNGFNIAISIHLMLMLIGEMKANERSGYLNFNTSHVNVNPANSPKGRIRGNNFNTSHVNVNR